MLQSLQDERRERAPADQPFPCTDHGVASCMPPFIGISIAIGSSSTMGAGGGAAPGATDVTLNGVQVVLNGTNVVKT